MLKIINIFLICIIVISITSCTITGLLIEKEVEHVIEDVIEYEIKNIEEHK